MKMNFVTETKWGKKHNFSLDWLDVISLSNTFVSSLRFADGEQIKPIVYFGLRFGSVTFAVALRLLKHIRKIVRSLIPLASHS